MPFWWRRRRKPWWGTLRRRRVQRYKRRRRTRFRRRRRPPYGRRRRRRRKTRKVRRKKKQIIVKQWQPDSIVKCKIKGLGCLVAGAQGRQFFCYTNEIDSYPQPKAPGGGGFGAEVYTLQYLYKQWLARKCIWTKSNDYKDLCRYTGTKIRFFRHQTTDFIASYARQPPFELTKDTYADLHPVSMLLSKHHVVIPSKKTKPGGRNTVTLHIKPPKQMLSKWYFQEPFSSVGLFQLQATSANLGFSYYGPNYQSRLLTFYALNTNFYTQVNWAQTRAQSATPPYYTPYPQYPTTTWPKYTYPTASGTTSTVTPNPTNYYESINYDKGFFQTKVLIATKIEYNQVAQHETPVTLARYNPDLDDGTDTAVWLTSIISDSHWSQPKDKDLIIVGRPLWMALYGMWNYVIKHKQDKNFLKSYMFVVQSSAIKLINNTNQKVFPILDLSFIQGKMPYGELLTENDKKFWYPSCYKQQETIAAIVEVGPYIPKYSNLKESTWELKYMYTCYFKWGGPEIADQPVQNPEKQRTYDVPDTLYKTIQVSDPLKQSCKAMLRAWDYRRGIITTTALKRMQSHLQTDSSLESDSGETPQKKKKTTAEIPTAQEENQEIQSCLRSLFEEDTCQDPQNLQHLIEFQQQQQQKLKHNIIKLLIDLKKKQRILQLQTGVE
nr:MAG: ORF1 [Torque teno midi virus]